MESSGDMSELSPDIINEIQKNIRTGAKDDSQNWSNALELTHKAYEVAGVQRPTPDMKSAWTQYETNLQYAVEQLAKFRGMDGDWRMSSSVFREALERTLKFRITEMGTAFNNTYTLEAKTIDDIINKIKDNNSNFDVKVKLSKDPENPNMAIISFFKWGVRKKYQIKIQQII